MMFGIPEAILLALFLAVPIACIRNWWQAWNDYRDGRPILAAEARADVPWGLVDVGLIIVVVGLIVGVGVTWTRQFNGIPDDAELDQIAPVQQSVIFAGFGTASLLATALSLAWLHLRWKGTLLGNGFGWKQLKGDIALGLHWFAMLIVPVVVVQAVLTRWYPSNHPLIDMMKESGNTTLLPVAAYAAVITAPLFEECLFRLILQGWLEKLDRTLKRTRLGITTESERYAVLIGGNRGDDSSKHFRSSVHHDLGAATTEPIRLEQNPYAPPDALGASTVEMGHGVAESRETDERVIWLPIFLTSALFALAHVGYGPDWIPLFFLALGLGFLYQRTGRIQACIVVHVLVNALGVVQLWAFIRQP